MALLQPIFLFQAITNVLRALPSLVIETFVTPFRSQSLLVLVLVLTPLSLSLFLSVQFYLPSSSFISQPLFYTRKQT